MADTTDPDDKCKACDKPAAEGQTMKRCGRCKSVFYCSRDCQRADWKSYKTPCANQAQLNAESNADTTLETQRGAPQGTNTPRASGALEVEIEKPFHKLHAKTWLHDRPVKDVYKLLIDTYRMRMEDDYVFLGEVDWDSLYSGVPHGAKLGFWRFLGLVLEKRELLPGWWSPNHTYDCLKLGACGAEWNYIECPVEKHDIIDHYKNPYMPMQLRMFAEQIYGTGPGGRSGTEMLQVQMRAENGERLLFNIDTSRMFRR